VGAIEEQARSRARHAFWLGLTALLACLLVIAAMIYRKANFLPDI
jgi:hypothetical protein